MKEYVKPELSIVELKTEERILKSKTQTYMYPSNCNRYPRSIWSEGC